MRGRRIPAWMCLPELARVVDHLLALGRAGVAPALAQHLTTLRRKLLKAAEVFPHPLLIPRRQRLEPLPLRAQILALLGLQGSPVREALPRLVALVLGHVEPAFTAVSERLLPLGRQGVPLAAKVGEQPLLLR